MQIFAFFANFCSFFHIFEPKIAHKTQKVQEIISPERLPDGTGRAASA